jgi:type II secretory pathway component PulF
MTYAVAAVVVGTVLLVPQLKAVLDRVKLALPVVGPTERDLAVNRFFHALSLVYSTGGVRVEAMIRLAAQAVGNRAIRRDLVRAAAVIEAGGTVTDAFRTPAVIAEEYREMIGTGEEAGKLEEALRTIARLTEQAMEHRLNAFNAIFHRLVGYAVVGSIAATAYWIAMTR